MIEEEEWARQHFEELKNIPPTLYPHQWRKDFKRYVDKFINEHLYKKEFIVLMPCISEADEKEERKSLHRLRHLVAGAVQECYVHSWTLGGVFLVTICCGPIGDQRLDYILMVAQD